MNSSIKNLLTRVAFYFSIPLLAGCSTVARNKASEQERLDLSRATTAFGAFALGLKDPTVSLNEAFDMTLHTDFIAIDKDFNTELDVLMNKAFATTDFIKDPFDAALNKFNISEQQAIISSTVAKEAADKACSSLLTAIEYSNQVRIKHKHNPNSILVKGDRKPLIFFSPTWCPTITKATADTQSAAYAVQATANAVCATLAAAYTIQKTICNPLVRAIATANGYPTTPNIIADINKRLDKVMEHTYNSCSRVLDIVRSTAYACGYTTAQPYNDCPRFFAVYPTNVENIHNAIQATNNAIAHVKNITKQNSHR